MAVLVVAMIGKFFATAAFDILYLVTAELYPTVLRSVTEDGSVVTPQGTIGDEKRDSHSELF